MKRKVAELEGALLDVAVGLCEGDFDPHRPTSERQMIVRGVRVLAGPQGDATKQYEWSPSTNWAIGGPIIEREMIALYCGHDGYGGTWVAGYGLQAEDGPYYSELTGGGEATLEFDGATGSGDTALIAAMRAYVASKLGDEVELP
jgi:hypothetical protein